MKKTILLFALLIIVRLGISQEREIAIDAPVINEETIGMSSEQYDEYIQQQLQSIEEYKFNKSTNGTVYQIPIVFHVLTDNENDVSNISDCIIQHQVLLLNNYYRKKSGTRGWNTNPVGADAEIEFFLPTKDPNGNPTNGIVHKVTSNCNYTTLNSAAQISAIKAESSWPTNKYLNVWVLKTMPNSNKVRAQAWSANNSAAGIFIHYSYLGSKESGCTGLNYLDATGFAAYNLGVTLIHECGHYLSLLHTFENCTSGDFCGDTPSVSGMPNPYCKTDNETKGLCAGTTRRMYENYMDYSDDACMNVFTVDQVAKMRAYINSSSNLTNIVSDQNIQDVGGSPNAISKFESLKFQVQVTPNPTKENISVNIISEISSNTRIEIYNLIGKTMIDFDAGNISKYNQSINLGNFANGIYIVKVTADNRTVYQERLIIAR